MFVKCCCGYQGAVAGWGAGLLVAFWIGIGSIVTQTSSSSLLPSSCKPILSDNTTAATIIATTAIQAAFTNVTQRYQPRLHPSVLLISLILSSVLLSRPSALKRLYSLSYMWYSAVNCFTVIIVGLMVSFLTGIPCRLQTHDLCAPRAFFIISFSLKCFQGHMKEEEVTPGTIYPLLRNLLFFLPEHLKKKLSCVTPLGEMVSQVIFNHRMSDSWQKVWLYYFRYETKN